VVKNTNFDVGSREEDQFFPPFLLSIAETGITQESRTAVCN
jgi:hypothetical protein